ncbi:MAG TPA: UbiA family prenyltransferase [Terriglobales bacterium]|nr:UbiA family prenyltransferase [Terriglobales bacterium]
MITTFAGFYLAGAAPWRDSPFLLMINTLLGRLLVASGTGTLNQSIERGFDAQMRRSTRRPLAAGRLKPSPLVRCGSFGDGLHHFRRLVIRWEYHVENFFGMVRLGCMQLLLRH